MPACYCAEVDTSAARAAGTEGWDFQFVHLLIIGRYSLVSLRESSYLQRRAVGRHRSNRAQRESKILAVTMGLKHISLLALLVCAASFTTLCDAALAPAIFVLGDSTVDTGNQNYITSIIKSNYAPYGIDFVPSGPTGRFSNGKLANDFIAEYLGLPSPVNFLSPSATGSALLTGVNLASSGSGYLDITGQYFGVVNLTKQIENLGAVQAEIIQMIGLSATTELFEKAIFIISTGSNDFVNNYNVNPTVNTKYTPQQWQELILDSINTNLQTLYRMGARNVGVDSLGPVGCAPEQLNLYNSKDGKCLDWVNEPLINFNVGLKSLVIQLRAQYPDFQLLYANVYDPLMSYVSNPSAFGETLCSVHRGFP